MSKRDNARGGQRDRALRALRDDHVREYETRYEAAKAVEGIGQDAVWRARRKALRGLRDQHRAEYDAHVRRIAGLVRKECVICGAEFWRSGATQCSTEFCSAAQKALRYLVDDDYREHHRIVSARWNLNADDRRRTFAARFLAGEAAERGRWLTSTSLAHELALECVRFDYPIVARFPDEVRVQLEIELGKYDAADA